MGSPAVLINHSMMQELNIPQTKFHSTVLGCCQACGRAACAMQRCSQGRRLDQQAAPGDTDQHYIVLGCTVGLSSFLIFFNVVEHDFKLSSVHKDKCEVVGKLQKV